MIEVWQWRGGHGWEQRKYNGERNGSFTGPSSGTWGELDKDLAQ